MTTHQLYKEFKFAQLMYRIGTGISIVSACVALLIVVHMYNNGLTERGIWIAGILLVWGLITIFIDVIYMIMKPERV